MLNLFGILYITSQNNYEIDLCNPDKYHILFISEDVSNDIHEKDTLFVFTKDEVQNVAVKLLLVDKYKEELNIKDSIIRDMNESINYYKKEVNSLNKMVDYFQESSNVCTVLYKDAVNQIKKKDNDLNTYIKKYNTYKATTFISAGIIVGLASFLIIR